MALSYAFAVLGSLVVAPWIGPSRGRFTATALTLAAALLAVAWAAPGLAAHPSYVEFHRALAEAARNPVHAVITHALIELEAETLVPSPELTEADGTQVDAAHRRIFDAHLFAQLIGSQQIVLAERQRALRATRRDGE